VVNIWPEFGFSESLYATAPITATAEGENLLVGRQTELKRLKMVLASTTLHPTIEGENGIGKTSLVAVAVFQLLSAFQNGQTTQAFVPLNRVFQLTPGVSVDAFRRQVLLEVAQGLIDSYDVLKGGGIDVPDVTDMRRWLTRSVVKQGGGGASALGFGISGNKAVTPSSSPGFNESGFSTIGESWLRQAYPSPGAGGFVCVIDNIELLETYQAAKSTL